MSSYESEEYFSGLYHTVSEVFSELNENEVHDLLRELILAPENDSLKIHQKVYTKTEVIIRLKEKINEENNPEPFEQRYQRFLDDALSTIRNMNDGYITEEDHRERNAFLQRIQKKEFNLFVLLALLKSCPKISDEEQENLIAYKIGRLRELKDLIEKYTLNDVNVQTDIQAYEQAKVIYKMLKSLRGLGAGYTISQKEKQNLGIDHDDDEDLSEDFAYADWIKRLMLRQLRRETRHSAEANANNLTDMFNSGEKLGLSRTPFDSFNTRLQELRGVIQKRRFDKNRFDMLERSSESK